MYFIYSLLLSLGFLILLPRFLFDLFRHGKYVAGFSERLGALSPILHDGRPVVWIHCVSVGETQAARPLVRDMRIQFPSHRIVISTITLTGQRLAREIFKDEAEKIFYFPFDWRWTVRRAQKAINPSAVLIMETELWPGFLRECQNQQIPVALINGRLSERAFRRYRLIKSFISRVLGNIKVAIMQTDADADRIRALGFDSGKTFVSGSLKFDAGKMPVNESLTNEFRDRFKLSEGTPLIVAASTHAPEEGIILDSLRKITPKSGLQIRLMIAPRHPERFAEVAAMIDASGFSWTRRTAPAMSSDGESEVILLDTIGELQTTFALASIVFVGGSIARKGGHNMLEPAAAGACIVTGAHTQNFELIVDEFVKAGAIIQLPAISDSQMSSLLANTLSELLSNFRRQRELRECARKLLNENLGATERTLELLRPMLASGSNIAPSDRTVGVASTS